MAVVDMGTAGLSSAKCSMVCFVSVFVLSVEEDFTSCRVLLWLCPDVAESTHNHYHTEHDIYQSMKSINISPAIYRTGNIAAAETS